MSDDLVERLRSPANVFYEYAADGGEFLREAADRIEKLEEALREVAAGYETEWSTSTFTNMMDVAQILSERINIARKALEGKDE